METRSTSVFTSSAWPLSGEGSGCYYKNNYDVASYGSNPVSDIPVDIRYYMDSFISADEMTMGCSSSSEGDNTCFGQSSKKLTRIGQIVFIVLLTMLILECCCPICCTCCLIGAAVVQAKENKRKSLI